MFSTLLNKGNLLILRTKMWRFIFIFTMAATIFGAGAQVPEFAFAIPELPTIQLCAIEEKSQSPVPFASISMEYADTIVCSTTDEMGLLDFTPRSFPLTLTANCEGMQEATYGIMEQPEGPLTILMTREPADDPEELAYILTEPLSNQAN